MNSLPTYNLMGEIGEKMVLPKGVFAEKVSPSLLAQAVRVYLSNQRKSGAMTKTRGDVSRTTAKMYKQKGTGRARHGSYSAPIFVGGGIAHGPAGDQNFKRRLSKTMTRKAIIGAMKQKMDEDKLLIIKETDKAKNKTKNAALAVKKITKSEPGKVLLIVTPNQKEIGLTWRNLKDVEVVCTNNIHPYFVILAKSVLITSEALEELVKTYVN